MADKGFVSQHFNIDPSILLSLYSLRSVGTYESARILAMFPTPSISHQVVFRPLTQELAKRGHEVIVITPDPAYPKGQAPKNLTEIDVHDISYSKFKILMERIKDVARDVIKQVEVIIDSNNAVFEEQMKTESVQEILKYKDDYFDLILVEACMRPAIGLSYVFKAPIIQDLKSYLDSSKNGVIYFSLGTNVKPSNLPSDKLQVIINVFSRLPYDVLWKWDDEELPGRTKNIKISKWLPQSDLLRHPSIKLFVTQGGLQSTDEAITAGVPVIGIPMLGDQWFNAEKYVHFNIGHKLDIDTLTEEQFDNAIKSILNNNSYRENIVRLRSIMQDQPQSPLDRAVWWTEHVLRHGGARHLRGPAANISWAQYLELELVLTLAAILISSLIILFIVAKLIWNVLKVQLSAVIKVKKS
ncbi:Ecdysteroid UDP-glucosyltransferase [Papilio machaon]|uniref:UDP-glucuronosyltransferase n=1 Tax=Papilio machaon TaxID=76193 RepID=A0A0N1PG92_PAPMA|nr:Ecdysteroid UDP-glucosyltransferase [Papilio machaon]